MADREDCRKEERVGIERLLCHRGDSIVVIALWVQGSHTRCRKIRSRRGPGGGVLEAESTTECMILTLTDEKILHMID